LTKQKGILKTGAFLKTKKCINFSKHPLSVIRSALGFLRVGRTPKALWIFYHKSLFERKAAFFFIKKPIYFASKRLKAFPWKSDVLYW